MGGWLGGRGGVGGQGGVWWVGGLGGRVAGWLGGVGKSSKARRSGDGSRKICENIWTHKTNMKKAGAPTGGRAWDSDKCNIM